MGHTNWEQHHPHESSFSLRKVEESSKMNGVTVDLDEAGEDQKDQGAFQPEYQKKELVYGVDDKPPFHIVFFCAFQVSG